MRSEQSITTENSVSSYQINFTRESAQHLSNVVHLQVIMAAMGMAHVSIKRWYRTLPRRCKTESEES